MPPSCPSRGTWIEIRNGVEYLCDDGGRAPRGARGLKLFYRLSKHGYPLVVPLAGHVD